MKTIFKHVLVAILQFSFFISAYSQTQSNIRVTKLKENFYRLTSMIPYPSNFLAYVQPEGILLVDAGQEQTGNELESVLKTIATGSADVKMLINTHEHIDHTGGDLHLSVNPLIIGPEILRETLQKYAYVLYDFKEHSALPSITFTDSINVYLGNEKIRIISTPGAHDATDAIVHFTNSGIVCLGDLSYGMTFPSYDGYTGNLNKYPEVIDKILTLIPDTVTIVSGHGREISVAELKQFRDMIVNTSKIVKEGLSQGKDIATMQREDILKQWSSYDGGIAGNRKTWVKSIAEAGPSKYRGAVPEELYKVLLKNDAEAAINRYYELKKNFPDQYYFAPRPIVRTANWLIGKGRINDAIKLFELCVDEYPDSPEGYNGLAESYLKIGDQELAIKYYKKVLEIEPNNQIAKSKLNEIE